MAAEIDFPRIDTITGVQPLDANGPMCPMTIKGLVGVNLYSHQSRIVEHIYSLIMKNCVETEGKVRISFQRILLSLALGGGKTFIVISLLLLIPRPRLIPMMIPAPHGMRVTQRITAKYSRLDVALIVAAPQVVEQWRKILTVHTPHFRIFTITSAHDLKEFNVAVKTGTIANYDIVLIKSGQVTGDTLNIPGEKQGTQQRNMVDAVARFLDTRIVLWLIFDDFDTAKIGTESREPRANFTIYVSATAGNREALAKESPPTYNYELPKGADPWDFLKGMCPKILNVMHDQHMMGPLSVRVSCETLEEMLKEQNRELPKYETEVVVLDSAENRIIGLIASMMGNNKEIVDMLCGEAVDTAATKEGIIAHGVADFLHKTLGNTQGIYKELRRKLYLLTKLDDSDVIKTLDNVPNAAPYTLHTATGFIRKAAYETNVQVQYEAYERALAVLNESIDNSMYFEPEKEDPDVVKAVENLHRDFGTLRTAYIKGMSGKDEHTIHASYGVVAKALSDELDYIKRETKAVGSSLDNIVENFKTQRCGVCKCEYNPNKPLLINTCCGVINCVDCGVYCNRFSKQHNYKTKRDEYFGKCSSCAKQINPDKDMFVVNKLDCLVNIAQTNMQIIDDPEAEVNPEKPELSIEDRIEAIKSPKCKTVMKIIYGMPYGGRKVEKEYPDVIRGSRVAEMPPGTPVKMLIFAKYDESFKQLQITFNEFGIGYTNVNGTPEQIGANIHEYEHNPKIQVMFINTDHNSAGMNLDMTTHVVFYHHIAEPRELSQSVARAQRYGKYRPNGYSLKVVFVLLSTELAMAI